MTHLRAEGDRLHRSTAIDLPPIVLRKTLPKDSITNKQSMKTTDNEKELYVVVVTESVRHTILLSANSRDEAEDLVFRANGHYSDYFSYTNAEIQPDRLELIDKISEASPYHRTLAEKLTGGKQ